MVGTGTTVLVWDIPTDGSDEIDIVVVVIVAMIVAVM